MELADTFFRIGHLAGEWIINLFPEKMAESKKFKTFANAVFIGFGVAALATTFLLFN